MGKRTEETDDVLLDRSAADAMEAREFAEMVVAVGGEGEGSADIRIDGEGNDRKSGKGRISLG